MIFFLNCFIYSYKVINWGSFCDCGDMICIRKVKKSKCNCSSSNAEVQICVRRDEYFLSSTFGNLACT